MIIITLFVCLNILLFAMSIILVTQNELNFTPEDISEGISTPAPLSVNLKRATTALGILTAMVTLTGLIGVMVNKKLCELFYLVTMLCLTLISGILLVTFLYIYLTFDKIVRPGLEKIFKEFTPNKWNESHVMNSLQVKMSCCGVDMPRDYEPVVLKAQLQNVMRYPGSCCIQKTTDTRVHCSFINMNIHGMGCYHKLSVSCKASLKPHLITMGSSLVLSFLALFSLFLLIL